MPDDLGHTLKSLHIPASPVVFANVWDLSSLNALLSLNDQSQKPVKAIATASWAVAAALGIQDEELTYEQNLAAIKTLGPVITTAGLPFSADLQDGYGDNIVYVISEAVKAGVVGANIEDSIPSAGMDKGISGSLYTLEDQVERLSLALRTATATGCPNFTLNARTDMFCLAEHPELTPEIRMKEAIKRGKAFLKLGATTVFVWGKYLGKEEIQTLVQELGGKVAIQANAVPGLGIQELADLGVARISVGPAIYRKVMETIKEEARKLLCDV